MSRFDAEPDWSEAFYPEPGAGRASDYRPAKAICKGCGIRDDCLTFAIQPGDPTNGEGVWGGCSPRDRELIRAERNRRNREKAS